MSLSPDNFKKELQDSASYFTKKGYVEFVKAIRRSRTIDQMRSNNVLFLEVAIGDFADTSVQLNTEKPYKEWETKLPLELRYVMGEKMKVDKQLATIILRQSSEPQNKTSGLGIKQWVSSPFID